MTVWTTHLNDKEQNEIKIKKLEMLKEHYKYMSDVLSSKEVIELLTKWQGKTYNKRLETALQKIDKHFHINKNIGLYLEFCFYDVNERGFESSKGFIYIDNYKHIIRSLENSSLYNDKLIAGDVAEQVLKTAEYYKLNYERLNEQITKIDEILNEYKEIIERYNKFEHNIDSDILHEFGLRVQSN